MSAFAGQIVEEPSCIAVFDAAPLLTCSEPAALAFHVGQAILVVQAERTNRRSIDEAIAFLRPCRHVGLVLNKALRHPGADGFALQARGAHQDVAGT
jgi:hypothetical protein